MSFCNICGSTGCPYCLGVRGRQPITYRTPLAHRSSSEQRIPVRPAQAQGLPAERLCSGQEPDAVRDHRVNVVTVHAPNHTERLDDVSQTEGQHACRNGQ